MARKTFEQIAGECCSLYTKIFPGLNPDICLSKALSEIDELKIALTQDDAHHTLEEYADVMNCILHSANIAGFTIYDLGEAMLSKASINRDRTWIRNENGTYSHAPEDWDREEKL